MIGDSKNDVLSGENAHCKKSLLVGQNNKSLLDIVKMVL